MQGCDSKPQCPASQLIVRVNNPYTYNHSVFTQQVFHLQDSTNNRKESTLYKIVLPNFRQMLYILNTFKVG